MDRRQRLSAPTSAPLDDDLPVEARQWQTGGLRLDGLALRSRETAPGLDLDHAARSPPRPADLPAEQQRAGPDTRRPEEQAPVRVGDEELPLGPVEQVVGVAARQQARGPARRPRLAHRLL